MRLLGGAVSGGDDSGRFEVFDGLYGVHWCYWFHTETSWSRSLVLLSTAERPCTSPTVPTEAADLTAEFEMENNPSLNERKSIQRRRGAMNHFGGPVWTQVLLSVLQLQCLSGWRSRDEV